ncbi:MAG: hypothetical protein ACT4O2_13365 [Beijerinckiaceae bacterium]
MEEAKMPSRYSRVGNVVIFASMIALPLALFTAVAKARGIGGGHQTLQQTNTVGRATNPPQLKTLVYDGRVDNCDVLNCGAVSISGKSQRNNFGDAIPFTAEIYADANECLRLEVSYQATNVLAKPAAMQIVLVSPTGSIWRNGDINNTNPVITARTDAKGHYTVQINHPDGLQQINSIRNFDLTYGRYVLGTPVNCPIPAVATFAALTN